MSASDTNSTTYATEREARIAYIKKVLEFLEANPDVALPGEFTYSLGIDIPRWRTESPWGERSAEDIKAELATTVRKLTEWNGGRSQKITEEHTAGASIVIIPADAAPGLYGPIRLRVCASRSVVCRKVETGEMMVVDNVERVPVDTEDDRKALAAAILAGEIDLSYVTKTVKKEIAVTKLECDPLLA